MNDFELKEIMEYNSETGLFTWLKRSESVHEKYMAIDSNQSVSHATKLWNSKHAGKNIGSNSNGYREVRIKNKLYRLHSLAWLYCNGYMPMQIDHINGIRHDNRIINLREVGQKKNTKNTARRKDNTSGFTGVYYFRRLNKWAAKIVSNGKQIHVGCFSTPEEADKARRSVIKQYGFHKNHGRDQHDEYK